MPPDRYLAHYKARTETCVQSTWLKLPAVVFQRLGSMAAKLLRLQSSLLLASQRSFGGACGCLSSLYGRSASPQLECAEVPFSF